MKTLGMIGGIGPESTIEYYRMLQDTYRASRPDGSAPPLLINSIDLKRMLGLIAAKEFVAVIDYLSAEVERVARAGADFGLFAANTPHIVFDELQRRSSIPLLSIVQATCEIAKARGMKKVGLLGTRFTMQGGFFDAVFAKRGIEIVVPDLKDQEFIHEKYMTELVRGVFLPETRGRLLEIADSLRDRTGIDGLVLGGTELPLALRETEHHGLPFLDTGRIHLERAIAFMLS